MDGGPTRRGVLGSAAAGSFASRDVRTHAGSRDVRPLQRFVTPRGEPRMEAV